MSWLLASKKGHVVLGAALVALACAARKAQPGGSGEPDSGNPDPGSEDPRWGCIGRVAYPRAPAPTLDIARRFFHTSAQYGDPADGAPFQGLTVDVCPADGACEAPLDTALTDEDGIARLTLPTPGVGFQGYLRVAGSDVVPLDLHMLPPISDADSPYLSETWVPVAFTTGTWAGAALVMGDAAVDPRKGHLVATTLDCQGRFSPFVTVTANGAEPDESAAGDNVFLNVEPGEIEFVGTLIGGPEVGRVTRTLEPGHLLAVNFGPTP